MGKGSIRRPTDQATYNENWDTIFGKKSQEQLELPFGRPDSEGVKHEESKEL